jgi:hypothetical protein
MSLAALMLGPGSCPLPCVTAEAAARPGQDSLVWGLPPLLLPMLSPQPAVLRCWGFWLPPTPLISPGQPRHSLLPSSITQN